MIYGYARVSTMGQKRDGNSLADQVDKIRAQYPTAEIVTEAYSGKKDRELFNALRDRCNTGDTLVVTKLDRFCRSTKEGLVYIDELRQKGVRIHILNMGLIDNTPTGQLMITMLLAFAEFEWSLIQERTQAGKRVKRETDPNYREGRKPIQIDNFDTLREQVQSGKRTVAGVCRELGISRSAWYNRVKGA